MALAPAQVFRWTRGYDGMPAADYVVTFFAAGTTTPKAVYTNPSLSVPYPSPSNTVTLNIQGFALIYLGPGGYKFTITDPNGIDAPYTQDNYEGDGSFGTGFATNFAALKDVNTNLNSYTYIPGYYNAGDGGEGMFYTGTATTANGGYIQDSDFDNTKSWFRIPDENGEVRAESFGYIGGTGTLQTTRMQAADAYAASISAALRINSVYSGDAQIGAMTFNAPRVIFTVGSGIKGTVSVPAVVFNGIVEGPPTKIFNRMTVTFSAFQVSENPQWFGAVSGSDPQTDALNAWIAAGGGAFILPPGTWHYAGDPGDFPWPSGKAMNLEGSLVFDHTTVGPGYYELTIFNTLEVKGPISSTGPSAGITCEGQTYSAYLQIVHDALIGGDVLVSGSITANADINGDNIGASGDLLGNGDLKVDGDVQAGWGGGGGALKAQAGTGTATFKAGGSIVGGIQSATITTSPLSLTIPANTFVAVNDKVIYKASGTYNDNANAWVIKIGVSTITQFFGHGVGTPGFWYFDVTYVKTASGTIKGIGFLQVQNPDASTSSQFVDTSSLSGQNFAADIALLLTGSAGTTTCDFAELTYQPARP